mmetsp:Transcript_50180/g.93285  ORF Transcript_50180/g.93285 Transcript_50180/m.93285 type:complete len:143 (+) Transcript_50180:79-507(+)
MASLLPDHYGCVILSNVVAPFIVSSILGGNVMSARKKFGVEYPNLYATPKFHEKADEFNLIQRGHQNMFETALFYVPMSILAGLQHPLAVAAGGIFYCIGCSAYQIGYTKGAAKRNSGLGVFKYVGLLTTLVVSIKFALTKI